MPNMRKFLVLLFMRSMVSMVNAQADYSQYQKYEATDMVKRYNNDPQIVIKLIEGEEDTMDTLQEYATGMWGAAVLIALGILCCIILCCYNLCTAKELHVDKCCTPPACCATKKAKWIQLFISVILLSVMLIFAFLGLGYTKSDDEAIRSIPDIMESAAQRLDFLDGEVVRIEAVYNASSDDRVALVDFVNDAATQIALVSDGLKDQADEIVRVLNDSMADIDEEVLSGTGAVRDEIRDAAQTIRDEKDSVADQLNEYQSQRNEINIIVLVVVILVGICAVVLIALPSCHDGMRDCSMVYCCSSNLIILVMMLVFITAGIYLAIVTLVSDICYDPTQIAIAALDLPDDPSQRSREQNMSVYYIECDTYSVVQQQQAWALTELNQEISEQCANLTAATGDLTDVFTTIGASGGFTLINDVLNSSFALCGQIVDDDGLLGYNGALKCGVLNSLYEETLILLCDDIHGPLALMFEFFVVIATILCISECLQKMARTKAADEEWDEDEYDYRRETSPKQSPIGNPSFDDAPPQYDRDEPTGI